MRIAKRVFAGLAVVFGLLAAGLAALPHLLLARAHAGAEAASIGIIGGADGPTAIFVATSWPSPVTIATILAVLCGAIALVLHLRGKRHGS